MNKTIMLLKRLLQIGRISKQQFKTFKGQVLHGDEEGCLKGLKRLNLI
jgi:hypothetical protein